MLTVKNLKKKFGNNEIWTNLNAVFEKGEVVSIQGRSGEGKTTFLRCLNNLEKVDSGTILIDEKVLCETENGTLKYAQEKEALKIHDKIGMVFQQFNLFPHLSVIDNLVLAPNFKSKEQKKEHEKYAKDWLEKLDLAGKENNFPCELSGGQQQRVAIARACMMNPEIICFDEPTSALDEETRGEIEKIIAMLKESGMCVLIVTHDRQFAQNISDRILNIENGEFREEIVER